MKIGLLTFQNTNNFGACLQAIALYKQIKKRGFDIEIIDYNNAQIHYNEVECIKPHLWPLKKLILWIIYQRVNLSKYKCLQSEIKLLTDFSETTYTQQTVSSADAVYDAFLVGSDQVWALNLTDYDYTYYLDFVSKDKIKLSFSSSISDEKSFLNDRYAQNLLKEFEQISVREQEAQVAINKAINREVPWVGDPTLLLTAMEWDDLIHPKSYGSRNVFIYFSDPNKKIFNDALAYAKRNGCEVWYCNYGKSIKGIKNVKPKSVKEWIGLIKYSRAVFTASYHGMLFSLYYQKQFVFYNRNQKSRMQSLSVITGTERNDGMLINQGNIPFIDYSIVNEKLDTFRNISIEVLNDTLRYVK